MARKKDYESMLQNWPYEYYNTRDAGERKTLLDMSIERGLDPEADKVRAMLWERRYPKGKTGERGQVDLYLKTWMDVHYARDRIKSRFYQKNLIKTIRQDLTDIGAEESKSYGERGEKAFYDELYHMSKLYIELCSEDRTYGTVILGIGKMSKDSFVSKIAADVYTVAYEVPRGLGMQEKCRLLTKAATEAFYDAYPNYEHFLDNLLGE